MSKPREISTGEHSDPLSVVRNLEFERSDVYDIDGHVLFSVPFEFLDNLPKGGDDLILYIFRYGRSCFVKGERSGRGQKLREIWRSLGLD